MFIVLLACTPDPDPGKQLDASPGDSGKPGDTADTGEAPTYEGCRATPGAADRDRVVVVSLPYGSGGAQAKTYALLTLSASGELSDRGTRFEMGRAYSGEVVFTPDGSLGLVPQDDGSVGVFLADGTVVDPGFGEFYASKVVVDPSGEFAWVVDGNWANNGGGIYRVDIDCTTGELTGETRVIEAKLPADIVVRDGMAVVAGLEVPGSAAGDDAALLSWGDSIEFVAGVDAFGDDEAIVTDAHWNGDYLFIADYSEFSGVPTRVAVVDTRDQLDAYAVVDVEDPVALVPAGDLVLVISGYGDAVFAISADGGTSAARVASSELPGGGVVVSRGALDGLVLVAEVSGLRTLRVEGSTVTDEGVFSLGGGYTGITGAVGVQP